MKITHLNHYDLTKEERELLDEEGEDYEGLDWLKIEFEGKEPRYICSAMEPEDARFYRSMAWIQPLLEEAYEAGKVGGEE